MDEVVDRKKLDSARDASLECAEAIHVAAPLLFDLLRDFLVSWKQGESPELDETSEFAVIYRKLQNTFDDVHSKWKAAFTSDVSDAILLGMPSGSSPVRAMDRKFASAHCAAGGALDVLGKRISILLDREKMLKFDDKFRRQVVAETIPNVPVSELRQGIDREWRDAIALTGVGDEEAVQPGGAHQAHRDGPYGHCQWRHNGEILDAKMQPGAWGVCKYLWGLQDKTAGFDDLFEPATGDCEETEFDFKSAAQKARRFFKCNSIPWRLSVSERHRKATLVEQKQKGAKKATS